MSNQSSPAPAGPSPKVLGMVGLAMFVFGCVSAIIANFNHDPRLVLGAAVLIPIGAMSLANTHTANVRAELLARIEKLEKLVEERK